MTDGIRRVLCLGAMLFLLPQASSYGEPAAGFDFLKKNVQTRTLGNGISVIALNRGYSPTLALIISFRVGSSDESYQTAGAAHMLEHMLFKGTDVIGTRDYKKEKKLLDEIEGIGEALDGLRISNPGDRRIPVLEKKLRKLENDHAKFVVSSPYDRIYSEIGGVGFNAATSRDQTYYFIEVPSGKLELWAQTESERLRNPVFREYYKERSTVVEERLMRYDSKGLEGLVERFIAAAFIAHSYRHPIIGWASGIRNMSIKDVRDFFRTYYIPSRMTITVVGRQEPDKTFAVIEKYFGQIRAADEPSPVKTREPATAGERRLEYYFDANPYVLIGWRKPTFPSEIDFACDVIAGILADGKTSRLYRSLVLEKRIAVSVDAWNGFPGARYDNLFVIAAAPRAPHTVQEVEAAIYEEIGRLAAEVSREEIEKVVNRNESSTVLDFQSNKGIASTLSHYQTVLGDWTYLLRYLDEIRLVTPERVRRTIDEYFTRDNRTVGVLLNKKDRK
ncbi:MAG: insulinase family protein [Spirochaetes bacterium]|jgi:predicted Zn-dependent peptidase|nr:insulinase family protein [Spirochaetota bacterium]